jgi:hypothetical protein
VIPDRETPGAPDDPDYVEIVTWLGIPERSRASMR